MNNIWFVSIELCLLQVSSYVLQVRAMDFGVPELSNFAMVNIDILDINDNPPIFLQPNYTAIVQVRGV